jgi:hypothetical protein
MRWNNFDNNWFVHNLCRRNEGRPLSSMANTTAVPTIHHRPIAYHMNSISIITAQNDIGMMVTKRNMIAPLAMDELKAV